MHQFQVAKLRMTTPAAGNVGPLGSIGTVCTFLNDVRPNRTRQTVVGLDVHGRPSLLRVAGCFRLLWLVLSLLPCGWYLPLLRSASRCHRWLSFLCKIHVSFDSVASHTASRCQEHSCSLGGSSLPKEEQKKERSTEREENTDKRKDQRKKAVSANMQHSTDTHTRTRIGFKVTETQLAFRCPSIVSRTLSMPTAGRCWRKREKCVAMETGCQTPSGRCAQTSCCS